MKPQTALPRLAREGWVPAGTEKRVNKRAMLIPKTGHVTDHLPTLMDFSEAICPTERRALREIVETAEVVREGDHLYLVARVSADTLDSLATFETSREDLEVEPDAEQVNEDGTNESALEWNGSSGGHAMIQDDREFDCPAARRRFIAERQGPPREHRYVDQGGRECRVLEPSRYDATKDQEEMRKVKRQLNALAAKKRKRVRQRLAGEARS